MPCPNFQRFTQAQAEALRKAIDEDKWYLSEEAHQDVGDLKAQEHFIDFFCDTWAAGFRAGFCTACEKLQECGGYSVARSRIESDGPSDN